MMGKRLSLAQRLLMALLEMQEWRPGCLWTKRKNFELLRTMRLQRTAVKTVSK